MGAVCRLRVEGLGQLPFPWEVDVDTFSEAEAALQKLNQHRADGVRSPHKPLLVLLAISQLAETGSSDLAWTATADRLADLVAEFAPPSRTSRMTSAAYPFTRLRSDKVWLLSGDVPMDNVTPLAELDVVGCFTPDIEKALLSDRGRLPGLARRMVEAQFPATVAPDVLQAIGFDEEVVEAGRRSGADGPAERRRSSAWRANILAAWDATCAFCGFDGSLGGAPVGVEAAHIRWFNFDGPDELDNGMALCSLHHKLFDRGALGLTRTHVVQVSRTFRAVGTGRSVYELHGQRLEPRPGTALPASQYIEWHASQVFRGDPLTAV